MKSKVQSKTNFKKNDLLTNNDLLKISINLSSLSFGIKTKVILNIGIGSTSLSLTIYVEKINLLKNSNVTNGYDAIIFQDSFKNLWTMSKDSKLQVLKANSSKNNYVTTAWIEDNSISTSGLTKSSNIINGVGGKIFQDEFKNLWAMGYESSLQVLKANQDDNGYDEKTGWTSVNDSGLTKGSNITNGNYGEIFQDQFKNLWVMSSPKIKIIEGFKKIIYVKLQVLKVNLVKDGYVDS